jgi:iron uptake system component EfeO
MFPRLLTLMLVLCTACGPAALTDAERRAQLPQQMHDSLQADLTALITAAQALQAATPEGRGWDAQADATAIAEMKQHWRACRVAYEHVEGALAPIFPDLDAVLDARYEDFLAKLGPDGDTAPFDGDGGTGMHWVERILFSDVTPARVVRFEETLPGYAAARFPGTEAEALAFKTQLLQRLIDDATTLKAQWQPAAIDVGVAFQGLVALMNEQREKVNKAATGEEESRYAQLTLFDLRNNLAGTATIYALFAPWVQAKQGTAVDDAITQGFTALAAHYDSLGGDDVPAPPDSWSSDAPTAEDLATPFGQLWSSVHQAVDPTQADSIVAKMNDVAALLGFPEFVEGS